ncbi:hypothetical protein TFLX_00574 [Thermoflexales bacterium]|nr:hypothetical protein TFLX_00574 [Thermoflexales bacterium]
MKQMQLRLNIFKSEIFDAGISRTMGYIPFSAASVGECFYAAEIIKKHGETFKSWVSGWEATAILTEELAVGLEKASSLVAAGRAYLRAWNYYRAAEFAVMPQGSQEQAGLYRDSIRCLDLGLKYAPYHSEKAAIPYENTSLPGYFFKASGQDETPRATIILNGGGDGAGEEMFFIGGGPLALNYGFNLLVFHGPGQRGALHQDANLCFRHDWENVLGPVIDYCQTRKDVDMDRLGVYGVSLGGFLVPRAAAFEKRIKAVAVNAILPNYYKHWIDEAVEQVPGIFSGIVASRLDALSESGWNKLTEPVAKKREDARFVFSLMYWTNHVTSMGEFYKKIQNSWDIMPLARDIRVPFLSLQSEGEGQNASRAAESFFEALTCEKKHIVFKMENGADQHCTLNNLEYVADVIYPWFLRVLVS